MKNRKKEIAALTAGLLAGSLLTGPATQAAQTLLTASPSAQKFYVDGQQVRLEAYKHQRLQLHQAVRPEPAGGLQPGI